MLSKRANLTNFIRNRSDIRKYILQNRNLSIRGMPKSRMPDRSQNFDIIDYMRLSFIENKMKNRIKDRLETWSSLGKNWNGTSIRGAMLKQVQPIMNFTYTNCPLAIKVLYKTGCGQKDETTMHFLGELTNR